MTIVAVNVYTRTRHKRFTGNEACSYSICIPHISGYLHVVDMKVLFDNSCGLLVQLFLGQGRLGGGDLGRWRGGSCLPLGCSHTKQKRN